MILLSLQHCEHYGLFPVIAKIPPLHQKHQKTKTAFRRQTHHKSIWDIANTFIIEELVSWIVSSIYEFINKTIRCMFRWWYQCMGMHQGEDIYGRVLRVVYAYAFFDGPQT